MKKKKFKKSIHQLAKENPNMPYKELEKYKEADRRQEAASDKPQAYQINYDDFCKGDEEATSQSSPRSGEPQASSSKLQASSPKHKASSFKPEATSSMIREPRNI